MELNINKSFNTGKPIDKSWAIISEIESVVKCLPGAQIKEKKGDNTYVGQMTVKMGPMVLNFMGEAEILEMNPETKTMRLIGNAKDAKTSGSAKMEMQIVLTGTDDCEVKCDAKVDIGGKIAQYGSRLVQSASNSIFDKFVSNFNHMLNDNETGMETSLGAGSLVKGMVSGIFKK